MRPARPRAYNRAVPLKSLRPSAHRAAAVLLAGLLAAGLATPRSGAEEGWRAAPEQVPVRYSIEARLVEGRGGEDDLRIAGNQRIEWRNTSTEDVGVVYLHLYANAFRDSHTTLLREARDAGWKLPEDARFGGIDVRGLSLVTGEPLELTFVTPDDDEPPPGTTLVGVAPAPSTDRTVARVVLPRRVAPGETLGLRLKFTTTLPSVMRRMGCHRGFVMAAQWYPKLGRYLGTAAPGTHEGWYCPQYHWTTEFCADYADYDVELRLRSALVSGATGERVEESVDEPRGERTERWRARGVVDFAWTAHERFESYEREIEPLAVPEGRDPAADRVLRERARFAEVLGVAPEELQLPKVKVRVLLQREHARQAERYFEAARVALATYGMWLGPYPYPTLTIVDPAFGAKRAGGMEYPQLVTAATEIANPPESLDPERVILHEIGHQWFMNVLASNEAAEAWLDEGLNTYFTARSAEVGYGPAIGVTRVLSVPLLVTPFFDFPGLAAEWPRWVGLPDWAVPPRMELFEGWRDLPPLSGLPTPSYATDPLLPQRRRYLNRAGWDDMVRPSWRYADAPSYWVNAYSRPALFVNSLRRTLQAERGDAAGERAFALGMLEYARSQRFRHPTTGDFLTAFGRGSGSDATRLFDALAASAGVLDYAIEGIDVLREPPFAGIREDEGGEDVVAVPDAVPAEGEAARIRTAVLVRRRGDAVVPVRIEVTRDSGDPERATWESTWQTWDGRERWHRFVFDGRIQAARLYPRAEFLQDADRRNDSLTKRQNPRPGAKWATRFLMWIENAALSYGRFL